MVCACCRPPGDPERDGLVARLAEGMDWSQVAQLAGHHRVEALVWASLARARVEPPPPVAGALRRRAGEIAHQGLLQAAESARLQAVLARAGVLNLLLKGAALDRLAWGRIGLKQAWDIDLLVDPGDVAEAATALAGEGYLMTVPGALDERGWGLWVAHAKESAWTHPVTGLVVELHWRLADAAGLIPGLGVRSPSRLVPLARSSDRAVRTFAAEETFAYLCVHGAAHGWSRLKWLADVGAILGPLAMGERLELHAAAVALGAGRSSAVALGLCDRLLGQAAPPAALDAARRDWRTRALVRLALLAMAAGGDRDISERPLVRDAITLSQILVPQGRGAAWAELRRLWFGLDDRLRLRLPGALGALYHFTRLPSLAWRRLVRPGQTPGAATMFRRGP
jgi:hypothetical protein